VPNSGSDAHPTLDFTKSQSVGPGRNPSFTHLSAAPIARRFISRAPAYCHPRSVQLFATARHPPRPRCNGPTRLPLARAGPRLAPAEEQRLACAVRTWVAIRPSLHSIATHAVRNADAPRAVTLRNPDPSRPVDGWPQRSSRTRREGRVESLGVSDLRSYESPAGVASSVDRFRSDHWRSKLSNGGAKPVRDPRAFRSAP
jgi:hypothetical protein